MQLRFEDILVDTGAREVLRGGRREQVTPKAFDLLVLLIGRRPNAVSKKELLRALWPETFVSEATVTALVSDLRTALGDSARQSRVIRTVHGYGYAFASELSSRGRSDVAGDALAPPVGWLIAQGWRAAVHDGEMILGREGEDVVAVPATTVSRRHAAVMHARGRITVRDLGSKNGTFVNDRRVVQPVMLLDGQRLRLGTFEATFRTDNGGSSTDTA